MEEKKNFLVVGGTSGIGKAIVENLTAEGHNVFVAARNQPEEEKGFTFHKLDVTETVDLSFLPDELHGLVYAPGTINLKPFHRLKPEDFRNDLEVNLLGAVKVIQVALPRLKASGNASVVMFSTVAVAQGMPFHASVASSKAAVEGLGKTLAAELAPTIRVNILAPGLTDTPLASRLLSTAEKREAGNKRHPLNRVGNPEDLANATVFLLSDKSSWITGQVVGVDGGMATIRNI